MTTRSDPETPEFRFERTANDAVPSDFDQSQHLDEIRAPAETGLNDHPDSAAVALASEMPSALIGIPWS
jgi:hypothetical protein